MFSKLVGRYLILFLVTLALVAPSQEVHAQSNFPNSMGIEQAPRPAEVPVDQWIVQHAAKIFVFLPQVLLNVEHENLDPRLPAGCYGWLEGYQPAGDGVVTDFFLCEEPGVLHVEMGTTFTVRTQSKQALIVNVEVQGVGFVQQTCWADGRVLSLKENPREFPSNFLSVWTDGTMCGAQP